MNETKLTNYHREVFLRKLIEIIYQNSSEEREAERAIAILLDDMPPQFNPIKHLSFEPIYAFDIDATVCEHRKFAYNPLYEQSGAFLCATYTDTASTISDISDGYELWLLTDMSIVAVKVCNVEVSVGNCKERATYRYRVKDGIYQFGNNFEPENFADTMVDKALFGIYGNEPCNGDCSTCPIMHENE